MVILFGLTLVLVVLGIIESHLHTRNLKRIPIRIHVNGTRGKSTTTRLIAGGLREAGFKVLAKTTGSTARLILEDGSEIPLRRKGNPNVIEQTKVIALACQRHVDAVVIECMAISPEMQWVSEHRLMRSTVGVITNARQDHSDQMGPTLDEVADTLSLTIPNAGTLVTAETRFLQKFTQIAQKKGTTVYSVNHFDISDEEAQQFTYPIFKENVACALKICSLLGVSREVALRGMWKADPDPGVMKIFSVRKNGGNIYLVNVFAANDYTSTLMAWDMWRNWGNYGFLKALPVVGLFNNRIDRSFRVKELSKLFRQKIQLEQIILLGQIGYIAKRYLKQVGIVNSRIKRYSSCKSLSSIDTLIDHIRMSVGDNVVLFGFGNIKGSGQKIVEYFEKNGEKLL